MTCAKRLALAALPLFLSCLPTRDAPHALELAATAGNLAATAQRPGQPIELGLVRWERDHGAAFARAGRETKPVLLFFQEVPG